MPQTRISQETRERVSKAWPDILMAIAAGEEIRKVLGIFDVSVNVARAYMAELPEARTAWMDAKADSADVYFDKVVAIANNPGSDPHRARVQADLWRWLAGKRNPREYSDKTDINLNVTARPDITHELQEASARLAAREAARLAAAHVIMGVAVRVDDEERG